MSADAKIKRDAWLCGYAAALAAVQRLYHEAQIVEGVIRADGLSPERLASAGAEEFDMRAIHQAWARCNPREQAKVVDDPPPLDYTQDPDTGRNDQ